MAEKRRKLQVKKRLAAGVLLLWAAGIGLGCGKGKETSGGGETTELFVGTYTMSPAGVLRANDAGYLKFFDLESDQTVYLCNQAGCSHRDADCSAYAERLSCAFYADDDLYLIQSHNVDRLRVLKANRYGEDRQVLGELDVFPVPVGMKVDGDLLYFIGDKWDFEKDENSQGLYTFRLSDGTLEALPVMDTGYRISNVSGFYVTDRYLYTQYTASDTDINDYFDLSTGELKEIDWDSFVYAYLLYRTDRQTGETELLIKEEGADDVGLTVLEAEGERFTVRLRDSILQYEGKEPVQTLYTYDGGKYWEVKPFAGGYLICESGAGDGRFRILENFTETGSFVDPGGDAVYYFGSAGDTLYFNGQMTLYYMKMEDFRAGNYEFHLIDIK